MANAAKDVRKAVELTGRRGVSNLARIVLIPQRRHETTDGLLFYAFIIRTTGNGRGGMSFPPLAPRPRGVAGRAVSGFAHSRLTGPLREPRP